MFTSQGLKHDKARRRKAAEEAKAAAAADREAAAKLAIAKEEEEEKAEEVEMSAVNEGFVDGVEGGSGEDSTAVGGGRIPCPNHSMGFLPLRAPDRPFSAPTKTAQGCRRRFGRFVGSASALIGEHRNLSRH